MGSVESSAVPTDRKYRDTDDGESQCKKDARKRKEMKDEIMSPRIASYGLETARILLRDYEDKLTLMRQGQHPRLSNPQPKHVAQYFTWSASHLQAAIPGYEPPSDWASDRDYFV